tara:strand:+ start:765 stop:899 length:135 start_codon:yes stop_codon:yes gene_type:complete
MDLEEIEELVYYNLSFGIPILDTLKEIKREDLYELLAPNPKIST